MHAAMIALAAALVALVTATVLGSPLLAGPETPLTAIPAALWLVGAVLTAIGSHLLMNSLGNRKDRP